MIIEDKPFRLDWKIKAGTTKKAVITFTDPNTKEPVDITDIIIQGDARIAPNTSELFPIPIDKLDQKTNKGQFVIEFTAGFTEQLARKDKPTSFNYDVMAIYPNSERYIFIEGTFTISECYTKDGDK